MPSLIDTDIHHEIRSLKDLVPYLPDQWKRYLTDYGWVPERAIPFNQIRKETKYRMDSAYKALRQETPWVKRMPSDYFRDNMRFTTQPWDDLSAGHFMNIVDMMGSEDMIMYASDYPHWDFDDPNRTLPAKIPDTLRQKIMSGNVRAFLKLP